MISRVEFARHVKDALGNLYNPPRLQTHPLLGLLDLPQDVGVTRGETLRQFLRDTIELLKPNAEIPVGRPEWDAHRVIWLHYVRSLGSAETCAELNMSESSFFRRQREALDALVSILWERYRGASGSDDGGNADALGLPSAEEAMQRSIALVREGASERASASELLEAALATVRPLAEQRGVAVAVDAPPSLPFVRADPPLLRQILVDLLAEGVRFCSGDLLEVAVSLRDDEMAWQLRGLAGLDPNQDLEGQGGFETSRKLLRLCEGRLWLERDERGALVLQLTLPIVASRTILVIDDDPGAIDLYRRYLHNREHILTGAGTAEQAQALLAGMRPDLVLLDVLMPREDGWSVLRSLKKDPGTAEIPVLVCSVISQPELALALGATRVLNKPFTPQELVQAIQECLNDQPSTRDSLPRPSEA